MEENGDQATDAASIKPVSSLRAKFEGLRHKPQDDGEGSVRGTTPSYLKTEESGRSTPYVRASFDLPRPSPWNVSTEGTDSRPRTPGDTTRTFDFPKGPLHKRPASVQVHSPKLTPALRIDSPRSPPKERPSSRSPERRDVLHIGKVRELVSQHSSRNSTRPPSPRSDGGERTHIDTEARYPQKGTGETPRSKSPAPPAVNRADKPKIPTKPQTFSLARDDTLTPETRRPSLGVRVSPFSTPPSSDGIPSPTLPSSEITETPVKTAPPMSGFLPKPLPQQRQTVVQDSSRSNDPRLMGFNKITTTVDRKDPRMLGFSTSEIPKPPDRASKPPRTPGQPPTPAERSSRDARDLGFGPASQIPRSFTSDARQAIPVTRPVEKATPPVVPSNRDPRQLGFSNSPVARTGDESVREPDTSGRPPPRLPPPRPSEESKRPVYQPGIMRPTARPPAQTLSDPPPRASADIPRQTIPSVNDISFPPPPKRSTFNDVDDLIKQADKRPYIAQPRPTASERTSPTVPTAKRYDSDDSDELEDNTREPNTIRHDYPDATQINRRPPLLISGISEINAKTDGKVFDMCGKFLCTAHYATRVFNMTTGEQVMGVSHGETVKMTAVLFKPAANMDDEGKTLWLGNNIGDLQEIDIETQTVIATSSVHNRREIFRILRCRKNLWTLDDDGKLFVWRADETGTPNLKYSSVSYKTPKGPTFAMVVGDKLWVASGKETRVFHPGHDATFNLLKSPLAQSGNGEVTCGAFSEEGGGRVYLGHTDGKVTLYSTKDYTCLGVVKASDYKINGLAFVSNRLWAAYKTGKVYVYDTSTTPWKVQKDWRAHAGPASNLLFDPRSVWTMQRLQVATAGHDNFVRLWDGMLEQDSIEGAMQARDLEYCSFRDLRAAVVTWNVGAVSPVQLRSDFVADAIHAENPPDIIVFGFQEVVDLEDRTVTAKSILGFGKKKDTAKSTSEQHQSRVYREWRDHLCRLLARYCPQTYYTEVHTSSLVGLFQCVFIRQSERSNITDLSGMNVKCGMGGHYGNKGALVTRFILDSSSLCFINCHLAAGQTSTSHRNNDVATILESENLPREPDLETRSSVFVGGGDGTQILDHEICILNGDLNYRIDAIPRDTVIKHVRSNDLSKLLERDQINVSRRRVAGFRLAPFTELPIAFAPTYKYDVGTDNYDSSEKKRSPAWCDRLLYRGPGRIKQVEYRRHDGAGVRVSDHRPVSGVFKLRVKKVDPTRRAKVKEDCHAAFGEVKRKLAHDASVRYLVDYLGVSTSEAKRLLSEPEK